jgi:hypothetical protein
MYVQVCRWPHPQAVLTQLPSQVYLWEDLLDSPAPCAMASVLVYIHHFLHSAEGWEPPTPYISYITTHTY